MLVLRRLQQRGDVPDLEILADVLAPDHHDVGMVKTDIGFAVTLEVAEPCPPGVSSTLGLSRSDPFPRHLRSPSATPIMAKT
jgi:hypothetical protein